MVITLNTVKINFNSVGSVEYWIGLIKPIYEPGIEITYNIILSIKFGWFIEYAID